MSVTPLERQGPVHAVLQRAAAATGVDFGYLLRTAQRESSLNPQARARTSSAAGLFQFIEQTWLSTLKSYGAKHGYGAYANAINRGRDGRFSVDGEMRSAVMRLRFDPNAASVMAAELTVANAAYLKGRIGRDPNQGELYIAHFMGPRGAAELIQARDNRPGAIAANLFPAPAAANRPIFYRNGRPATVDEVYANLVRKAGSGEGVIQSRPEPEEPTYLMAAMSAGHSPSSALSTLIQMQEQSLIQMLTGGAEDGRQGKGLMAAFGPGPESRSI